MSYTFRAAGTMDFGGSTISPGAPAGKAVGDLLLLATAARNLSDTFATPSGWTTLYDTSDTANATLYLCGRIADGTATDTPSFDWTGSADSIAQIAAFYGGGYTDLATILAHSAKTNSSANVTDIPNPALTITTDNCLVIGVGKKAKTNVGNGTISSAPAGLDNNIGFRWNDGSNCGFTWDYTIQTSASSIGASVWNQSGEESLPAAAMVVALKSGGIALPIVLNQYRQRRA